MTAPDFSVTASRDFAAHQVVIHHSMIFDGKTPADCGASGVPCPAANEWRYVGCPRCLALKPPEVHARASAGAKALCGMAPDCKRGTRKQSEVTCSACRDAVERLGRENPCRR